MTGNQHNNFLQAVIAYLDTMPTANAGIDQNVVAGASVILDGSASSDTDGSIVSYEWVQFPF